MRRLFLMGMFKSKEMISDKISKLSDYGLFRIGVPIRFPGPKTLILYLISTTVCVASPHYSIETIHHDIMRAKAEAHNIFEVEVSKIQFRRPDTISVDRSAVHNCKDSCNGFEKVERRRYQIELKVNLSILNPEHPRNIPLFVIDKRSIAGVFWPRAEGWIKRENPIFIAVVDARGNLVAFYPEKFGMGGDPAFIKEAKPKIFKDIMESVSSKEYTKIVNRKNLIDVLNRAGLNE